MIDAAMSAARADAIEAAAKVCEALVTRDSDRDEDWCYEKCASRIRAQAAWVAT
jgi:hypothetical protein